MAEFEVGFRKPPRSANFKKGQSGNPKGRPKGARGVTAVMCELLKQPVTIPVNGKKRKISTLEAVLQKLRIDALRGDAKTTMLFVKLAMATEAVMGGLSQETTSLSDEDQHIIADMFARVRRQVSEEK